MTNVCLRSYLTLLLATNINLKWTHSNNQKIFALIFLRMLAVKKKRFNGYVWYPYSVWYSIFAEREYVLILLFRQSMFEKQIIEFDVWNFDIWHS